MHLVVIPNTKEATDRCFPVWWPFLKDVSRRSKEPVEELQRQVARREVQLVMIWDGERAHALIGIRINRRGNDLVGQIAWMSGKGMREWLHLLSELEQYFQKLGCVEARLTGRRGWSKVLKSHGYKLADITMEKPL